MAFGAFLGGSIAVCFFSGLRRVSGAPVTALTLAGRCLVMVSIVQAIVMTSLLVAVTVVPPPYRYPGRH